jgi:hypothetical protein
VLLFLLLEYFPGFFRCFFFADAVDSQHLKPPKL